LSEPPVSTRLSRTERLVMDLLLAVCMPLCEALSENPYSRRRREATSE
jgi:hypothetical protein